MLKNEKILITGITSPVAEALAARLVGANEVWGAARFSNAEARGRLEAGGVRTAALDLSAGDLSALPADFTYVLHLAYFRSPSPDFEEAFRVNADGVGFVFNHCRGAKAALYMSSSVIYSFHEDPWREQKETDPIGWAKPGFSATANVSKVAGEAVARYCARQFDLPVVIARLNAPYGPTTGLPVSNMDQVVAGTEVFARWEPEPYTPIHLDDMSDQLEALLDAAGTPATVVNWAGDEYVTVQQWSEQAAEMAGMQAKVRVRHVEGSVRGSCNDVAKRKSITGPCRISFKDGFRDAFKARHG
jgi:nucleoside-diphosphate-sugar epimerase